MTSSEKLLATLLPSVIIFGAVEGGAVAALSNGNQLLGVLAGLLFAGYSVILGYILYRTEGGNRSWFFHELVEETKRTMQEGRAAENGSYLCLECGEEIPEGASFCPGCGREKQRIPHGWAATLYSGWLYTESIPLKRYP